MRDQRPMFRFRLPWTISSAAPAPPLVATQSLPRVDAPSTKSQPQTSIESNEFSSRHHGVDPTMPAQRPFRLPSIAPAHPPPPIQPTVENQRQSEPITITSTPKTLPQASSLWSPKISTAQDPLPQAEASPETKSQSQNSYQPTSPSRTHSEATSQLPSPSSTSAQFSATSQLPSPQLSASSQPPSPWRRPSQERDISQLPSPKSVPHSSSPWRTSPKARDASQHSSPDRPQFQKSSQAETFHQPQSPSQLKFQSSGQTSPSLTVTNVQQQERTATQSPPRDESPSTTSQPQTNIEPNVNSTIPARRPFRLPGIAPAQPPPPIQPSVQSQRQSEPITITSVPTIPPQATPLWSPKISGAQVPLPQAEESPETKTQSQNSYHPVSPSRTHSQATSQLPSPSLTSAHYSATSQLPSPQPNDTSEPLSPRRIHSQERDTSRLPSPKYGTQPSSPWRTSNKQRDASQPSSPNRPQFQKSSQAETTHPQSPSQLDFQSSGQTSPITSYPSLTATNVQAERTATQLPSPSIMLTHKKSPQPSASSNKPLSHVSVGTSVAVFQPQLLEDRAKTKFTTSVTFNSPTKATLQPTDSAAKPPKRDIETIQNTSLVAQKEPKQKTMAVHFSETSGSPPHNKEKLKIAFQAEQRRLKNQDRVIGKEATTSKTSSLDGKQTKTMTSQQTNRSTVSESHKKLMISNGDRVPFEKEIRNYISMIADKMAIAHPENSKDEQLTSVVALVGINKGASMQLGANDRANKTEPVEGTKANEINKSTKLRRSNNENNKENRITKAFINNNVQDINNSILMNSFITERNPGVHLALYYDPTEPIMSYDIKGSPEARKGKLTKRLHMSPPSEGDP